MKKTLNNIFDEADACEIETLVNQNAAPEASPEVLTSVKNKVYAKTNLKKEKKSTKNTWLRYVAVAACFVLILSATVVLLPMLRQDAPWVVTDPETTEVSGDITDTSPLLNDTDPIDTQSSGIDSIDYKIIQESGKNYIVFDNIADYNDSHQQLGALEFENLAQFKDCVTKGKLADWQKEVIATSFEKDETGGVLTCDFNKLLEPQMPNGCTIDGVSWSGEAYSFSVSTSSEVFGFIHNYTQSQYNEIFHNDFENFFNKTTIKKITETNDGKTVTTFCTFAGDFKNIRYTKSIGNKTIIVEELYRLTSSNDSLPTSDSVPTNITLYCTEEGAYYVVDLFGFVEYPSDSWLYDFGMKLYVEHSIAENN